LPRRSGARASPPLNTGLNHVIAKPKVASIRMLWLCCKPDTGPPQGCADRAGGREDALILARKWYQDGFVPEQVAPTLSPPHTPLPRGRGLHLGAAVEMQACQGRMAAIDAVRYVEQPYHEPGSPGRCRASQPQPLRKKANCVRQCRVSRHRRWRCCRSLPQSAGGAFPSLPRRSTSWPRGCNAPTARLRTPCR
jgi:hypothetical protein